MTDILLIILIMLVVFAIILLVVLISKNKKVNDFDGEKEFESQRKLIELQNKTLIYTLDRAFNSEREKLSDIEKRVSEFGKNNEIKVDTLNRDIQKTINDFSTSNEKQITEMRFIVDEKLTSTLEKRLESSYNIIAENLNKVSIGIGEVNKLADGINDIKRVFSNVKLRGTWGEVQLNGLLEDMLNESQFARNCRLNPNVDAFVDFAIILPDKNNEKTYLPIDSKFPIEEYQKMIKEEDENKRIVLEKNLVNAIKKQADSISMKYVFPPLTTDFAIMYLPLEGLYAEVLKQDELMAYLHKKRIMASGPTNLGALLNSLQVGFKTVAIEKRSRELWQLLSVFKVEFNKFNLLLEKTGKKLQEAQDTIELASKKTRTIERKLKTVNEISDVEADKLLEESENE